MSREKRGQGKVPLKFAGSLMEGPEINLIEVSGLSLSEDELDELWSETSPLRLIRECLSVEEFQIGEADEIPGMSDVFYEYEVLSAEEFVTELRKAILRILEKPIQNAN